MYKCVSYIYIYNVCVCVCVCKCVCVCVSVCVGGMFEFKLIHSQGTVTYGGRLSTVSSTLTKNRKLECFQACLALAKRALSTLKI